jgi:phosphatidylserine/phosphatidylglycerophosphate/cardiolipin synthase-like enzyme
MNELTKVGTVAALSNFMYSYSSVGSASADAAQLQAAFLTVNQYTNTTNGTTPGPLVPIGYSAPTVALQTLGDIIATCVNSAGGVARDLSACGQLFTLATISGNAAPTDTVRAILNILKQPTANVSALYALLSARPPFAPTPLYAFINAAQKTIDMTMYALQDTTFSGYLVAACNRGVKVRVILDQNNEKSNDTPAYNQLNGVTNCSAVWANKAFQVTHQKSIIVDGTQVAIMSLNLQSQYFSTTRDFALIEADPVEYRPIQATFNADYAAGTPTSGVAGVSDYTYQPGTAADLIWSPTTAQAAMTAIITSAKSSLLVENEELASSASYIITALENACARGVTVHVAMVNQTSYQSNYRALENSGCGVHVYPDTQTGFCIYAKAVVADYGLPTQSVYMGSINYSNASMTQNRELGVYITDPASVQLLYSTMASDYAGGSRTSPASAALGSQEIFSVDFGCG